MTDNKITNRQLLDAVLKQTSTLNKKVDELAIKNYELSAQLSIFMNNQDKENLYFKSILERNDKTGQVGIVSQVGVNTNDINQLKLQNKVNAGKIAVGVLILSTIGGIVLKLLGFITFR